MLAVFKRARQVLGTRALAPVLTGDEMIPGPNVQTDEQIMGYLRASLNRLFHAFANNKMGKTSDSTVVVDGRGRVIGFKNRDLPLFLFLFSSYLGGERERERERERMRYVCEVGRDILLMIVPVRVVDCSSFPFLPPGPAPQIQVCEFFSPIILNWWFYWIVIIENRYTCREARG